MADMLLGFRYQSSLSGKEEKGGPGLTFLEVSLCAGYSALGFPFTPSLRFHKEGVVGPLLQTTKGTPTEPKEEFYISYTILLGSSFCAHHDIQCILNRHYPQMG